MFKSKSTQAIELLDQFRWIFQEVTNRNGEIIESMQSRIGTLETSLKDTHKVLGQALNLIESLNNDITTLRERLNED
jgi:peptidoglycan hydrolase CwlO-like protein